MEEEIETTKTEGAGTPSTEQLEGADTTLSRENAAVAPAEERGVGAFLKRHFTGKRIAAMAIFTALAYALSWAEIPTPFFGASFLKLDFGNAFILLVSFLLGPMEGVIVCLLKEAFRCFTSATFCSGELANFLLTSIFSLLPSIVYQYRRRFKTVAIWLPISCVVVSLLAPLANRWIIFPTYEFFLGSIFGLTAAQAFEAFWYAILLFNVVKSVSVAALTLLLYKRLSNIFKKWKI